MTLIEADLGKSQFNGEYDLIGRKEARRTLFQASRTPACGGRDLHHTHRPLSGARAR
jgi:hypothetical protein